MNLQLFTNLKRHSYMLKFWKTGDIFTCKLLLLNVIGTKKKKYKYYCGF